jgi:[acyl-carrier-protein] S-malonyltransferase
VLFVILVAEFYSASWRHGETMLVIAAPGQGAQAPGFLTPWLAEPGMREQFATWSELAGCDLIACGTTAGADEIRDTAIAQPLLVAAGIAAAGQLFGHVEDAARLCGAVAGHSVGELVAGVMAGVISAEDALRLVRVRSGAMARAAAADETGMTAVLGGDEAGVLARLEELGLQPANVNGAGQIVAAGTMDQLSALAENPPAGARLRSLPVAGAFHTHHMAPAVAELRAAADGVTVADPRTRLVSNHDGAEVATGPDWMERIITQVSAPVRWDACMRTLTGLGASAIIELPPAGTLTGLARRAMPDVDVLALKTPADLDRARALVAAHAVETAARTPEWRLLVAPMAGTFRRADLSGAAAGQPATRSFPAGAELGHVIARGNKHAVMTSCEGDILEWLAEDGDPVSAGQPLVRLQPEAGAPQ